MAKERLSRTAWLEAGFRALVSDGPDGLRAERLARGIGATKGSFYWHFKDVADFRAALLDHWQDRAFSVVLVEVGQEVTPAASLRKLAAIAASGADARYGGIEAEPAIRAWARSDATVRAAVARIDAARLGYLSDLLRTCDVTQPGMARILYAAAIGMEALACNDGQDNTASLATLVDMILASR